MEFPEVPSSKRDIFDFEFSRKMNIQIDNRFYTPTAHDFEPMISEWLAFFDCKETGKLNRALLSRKCRPRLDYFRNRFRVNEKFAMH